MPITYIVRRNNNNNNNNNNKKRIIHGFLSREMVNELLKNESEGSFLVRFSESNPGEIAVAYRVGDDVRHYLIRNDIDVGPKKLLSDFLIEQPAFTTIMLMESDEYNNPKYCKFKKEVVLELYISSSPKKSAPPGYDLNVQNLPSSVTFDFNDFMNAE